MSDIAVTPVVTPSDAPLAPRQFNMTPEAPQVPQVEAPKVDVPEAPKEDPKFGRRFAEIAKRETAVVQTLQHAKELEATYGPVKAALEQAKVSKNPAKALAAFGYSLDDVIEFYAEGNDENTIAPVPEITVEERVEQVLSKKEQERQEADRSVQVSAQIEGFKAQIAETAASSEAYELVHSLGQTALVYDVVLSHHSETGEVLSIEEALKMTEAYLEQESRKILSAKKFSSAPAPQASRPAEPQPKSPFTLSRHQTASPTVPVSSEKLTREQAADRAASMLRFK